MAGRGTRSGQAPPLHVRMGRVARQRVLRATTNPFASGSDRVLLVHCGHHKAATVWFRQILLEVMRHYGLRQQEGKGDPIRSETDLAFYLQRRSLRSRPGRTPALPRLPPHPGPPRPRGVGIRVPPRHRRGVDQEAESGYGGPATRTTSDRSTRRRACSPRSSGSPARPAPPWERGTTTNPSSSSSATRTRWPTSRAPSTRLFSWYGFDDAAAAVGLEAVDRLSLKHGGRHPEPRPLRASRRVAVPSRTGPPRAAGGAHRRPGRPLGLRGLHRFMMPILGRRVIRVRRTAARRFE